MTATVTANLSDLTNTALVESVIVPNLRKFDHLPGCQNAARHAFLWATRGYNTDNLVLVSVATLELLWYSLYRSDRKAEILTAVDMLEAATAELVSRLDD